MLIKFFSFELLILLPIPLMMRLVSSFISSSFNNFSFHIASFISIILHATGISSLVPFWMSFFLEKDRALIALQNPFERLDLLSPKTGRLIMKGLSLADYHSYGPLDKQNILENQVDYFFPRFLQLILNDFLTTDDMNSLLMLLSNHMRK